MERRTLYFCYNHGVVAVVSEETMRVLDLRRRLKEEKSDYEVLDLLARTRSIFTFSDSPDRRTFVCGPLHLLERLLEESGATIKRASFYVPFSQPEIDEEERRFMTTIPRLRQDFGLERLPELRRRT